MSISAHTVQAQVFPLFHFSRLSTVTPYRAARIVHVSPLAIKWVAQVPLVSGLGKVGEVVGRSPAVQQNTSPFFSVVHRDGLGLYLTNNGLVVPHFLTRVGHVS